MKEFAKSFYLSAAWKKCRASYIKSVDGICENCLRKGLYTPGKIVHHKIHLTPENINNPNISLSWDNLELLCQDCHTEEHDSDIRQGKGLKERRYKFDKAGNCIEA